MSYEEIIKDEQLLTYLKEIDQHPSPISHGLTHALGVVHNVELLGNLLNIDKEELNYLKIAAILHDTGTKDGQHEHWVRSAIFAKEYLKDKISAKWCERIVDAIYHHHEKENINTMPLFDHILLFADKSDVSKKRVNFEFHQSQGLPQPFIAIIKDISYKIENDTFIISYTVTEKKNLENWEYFPKLSKRAKEFSQKIGLNNYEIRLVK